MSGVKIRTALVLLALCPHALWSQAVRQNAGFRANSLTRDDDNFTPSAVSLGFTINFFGRSHTSVYVNNNGNLSFGEPNPDFTPQTLNALPRQIIAPFWADVDTPGQPLGCRPLRTRHCQRAARFRS